MWYLNYCAPFIYSSTGTPSTSRYTMYTTLLLLLLTYILHNLVYKLIGSKPFHYLPLEQIPLNSVYSKNQIQSNKHVISYPGFGNVFYLSYLFKRQYRMNLKKFKQWYTHYFGLHAIATAAAIMYSPFVPQMVFTIIWTLLFIICSIMNGCQKKGAIKIIFNSMVVICVFIDIILLFSAAMGIGASGYDDIEKICYWQRS